MRSSATASLLSSVTCLAFVLLLILFSSRVSTSEALVASSHHYSNYLHEPEQQDKLSRAQMRLEPELSSSTPFTSSSSMGLPPPVKSRRVREIREGVEDDSSSSLQDFSSATAARHLQRQQPPPRLSSSSKVKGGSSIYPAASGSGELLRMIRPLALSPDKTIGMTRWYLPGFGYFARGGRASSNFIRFGRSNSRFLDDEDEASLMLTRNNAKKKNNFIRLGRENPRTTNFIRLGRSGGGGGLGDERSLPIPEFYNSEYPSLSDVPFRMADGSEDARQDVFK